MGCAPINSAGASPGFSLRALQAVRSLAKHYNRSPELLDEEEVRLLDVRERNARGSFKTSHYGIQFFYQIRICQYCRSLVFLST